MMMVVRSLRVVEERGSGLTGFEGGYTLGSVAGGVIGMAVGVLVGVSTLGRVTSFGSEGGRMGVLGSGAGKFKIGRGTDRLSNFAIL